MSTEKISITHLRQNLFNIVDQVLASGQPVEVERHGRRVLIVPEQGISKLSRLKARPLVKGDAASLADEKVWGGDENASRV